MHPSISILILLFVSLFSSELEIISMTMNTLNCVPLYNQNYVKNMMALSKNGVELLLIPIR